jgi:flagellar protein FlaG
MQPVSSSPSVAAQASRVPQAAAERPSTATEKPRAEPEANLGQAALQVERFVQTMSSDLQFSVDESSGNSVVRVIDRATQEVIRQIPSEEMLAIARALDRLQGLLIRQKA